MADDAVSEIEAKQRADRRQIRTDADLMIQLLKHPAWARYLALIEAVGQNFHTRLMTPMENSFEAVKMEHAKGALIALSLAAQLPSAKIREAEELRSASRDEE